MSDTKQILKIEPDKKYLDITWQVNNFCNYRCSYCNPGNYEGSERNDSNTQIYLDNLKIITERYLMLGYSNFKMFFSGGEPTIWRNLIPVIEWAKDNLPNVVIAVNTNFSRPTSWWEDHYHLFDDVVASFHVEFADKDRYLSNAYFLHNKVNYLSCKMLLHDERFWEVVEFGELLKEKLPNYFIEWTPLYDEMSVRAGPWEYKDPKKVEFINSHSIDQQYKAYKPTLKIPFYTYTHWDDGEVTPTTSNEVIIRRLNHFSGWKCSIGDNIWINQNGQISMGTCGQVGVLGNILREFDSVGPKKIICKKDFCHCGTDIMIPKQNTKLIRIKNEQ